MSVSLRIGFLAALAMLLSGNIADAAVIDYIFTGTCGPGCTLNGTSFTSFTVTEVGDTTAVTGTYFNNTTGTFITNAGSGTLTNVNSVNDNPVSSLVAFAQEIVSPFSVSDEALINSAFLTYNLATALSLTPDTGLSVANDTFTTNAGSLIFANITQMSFQAVIPSAVPEPTSLAILGTALFGFGLIRRRRKQV